MQSRPTLNDIKKMERLLQYVSVHQHHGIRYHASNMQLQIQSDASFLCRPQAKSVLGGFHYLGTTELINGPIFCTSKLISCIVSSAAEAELGAAFQNAQKGAHFRNTLKQRQRHKNKDTDKDKDKDKDKDSPQRQKRIPWPLSVTASAQCTSLMDNDKTSATVRQSTLTCTSLPPKFHLRNL